MASDPVPICSNDGDMTGAVLTARDITEQRANERWLRASEARLSSIIDTAPDSIIVLDEKGIIQSVNRATANIFGYTPEELIGQHVNFLMPQEFRKQHRGYLKAFAGAARIEEMEALNARTARWSRSIWASPNGAMTKAHASSPPSSGTSPSANATRKRWRMFAAGSDRPTRRRRRP